MLASADLEGRVASAAHPAASAGRLPIGSMILLLALAVVTVVAASFCAALSLIAADVTRQEVGDALEQLSKSVKFLLKFDVGGEQTVAAWLSSMLMLLCALLLLHLGSAKRWLGESYAMHWLGLGVVFLGLSMDEAVGFHEMTIMPVRELLQVDGMFLYAWVVPALLFVSVVGLVYLGFLCHLEPAFRLRLLLAAALFVGGAVGFEMLEGALADFYRQHRLLHETAVHLEDTAEFAGLLVFLHALLVYARNQRPDLRLRLG